jgi:hypothetical protein
MRESRLLNSRLRRASSIATDTRNKIRSIKGPEQTVLGQTIFAIGMLGTLHSIALADAGDHQAGFVGSGPMWDGAGGVMMFHWLMMAFVIGLVVLLVLIGIKDKVICKLDELDAEQQETTMTNIN